MKALHELLKKDHSATNQYPLFSKLKEIKLSKTTVGSSKNVPLVYSDSSEEEDNSINQVYCKLNQFKRAKAKQIANIHQQTGKSLTQILNGMKMQINRQIKNMVENKQLNQILKSPKEMASTLPNSEEKKFQSIETPCFQVESHTKPCSAPSTDLRQFTLGQKQWPSDQIQFQNDDNQGKDVSEFSLQGYQKEGVSKKIKKKIINGWE